MTSGSRRSQLPRLVRVIARIDLRGSDLDRDLAEALPRAASPATDVADQVRPIVDAVRRDGAAAVRAYTKQFDRVERAETRVPKHALASALDRLDPALRAALAECARRTRVVHEVQRRPDETVLVVPGGTVTERWLPVRRVGLYVPGGLVAYPSSVVMSVIPAQVAGVSSLAVASPPKPEYGGLPHPVILGACALLGVEEVYAAGGAQAVAMLGYGTAECPPVDLVTGPGNAYVAAAKRLLQGHVGVDAEAGPTEIAILADRTAPPAFVAADLIAQAEHDERAACLLVTPDPGLLDAVGAELIAQLPATAHRARVEAALRDHAAAVLVDDLDAGLAVVEHWAPEHLEIITADAAERAGRVRAAGAVFVGPYAPVSLGDYLAGSNHVLPTGGTARFSGGLSVQSFLRSVHVVSYDEAALASSAGHIDALGAAEQLPAHVAAVRIRVPG